MTETSTRASITDPAVAWADLGRRMENEINTLTSLARPGGDNGDLQHKLDGLVEARVDLHLANMKVARGSRTAAEYTSAWTTLRDLLDRKCFWNDERQPVEHPYMEGVRLGRSLMNGYGDF